MGLFSFIDKQFLDIIQWNDDSQDIMIHKHNLSDNEIQNGSVLVVMPSQAAIFISDGNAANVFGEGRYELQTENRPFTSDLKGWKFKFESSHKQYIYFVNTKNFLSQKWGTPSAINIFDPKFEQVPIRAFGSFAFKITDPIFFMRTVTSTNKEYTASMIKDQLKDFVLNHFAEIVQEQGVPATEISRNFSKIAQAMKEYVKEEFSSLGLEMTQFAINNITFPENIQKMIDARTSVNIMGGMKNYSTVETFNVMHESVEHQGLNAMSQAGMGLGIGASLGRTMTGNVNGINNQDNTPFFTPQPSKPQQGEKTEEPAKPKSEEEGTQKTQAPQTEAKPLTVQLPNSSDSTEMVECQNCHAMVSSNAKFCMECGSKVVIVPKKKFCPECGNEVQIGQKFCMECGTKLA